MRQARRWLAIGAVFALVASACGGEDPPSGGGGGGGETPAQDLSGETIEVAAIWGDDTGEASSFAQVSAAFEEATGATVEYTSTGEDLASVIGPRLEGGDPPDVAILPQPGLLRDFVERGALIPIEDAAGETVDANYASTWRDLGSVDGELYGVWFKLSNKSTFWYNLNVFGDAGVEPPATWEDLIAAMQTVSDFGVPPHAVDGASGWVLSDWFENIYLRTAGPEMYDQLSNHEIPWTDPSVIVALERMQEAFEEDLLAGGIDGTLQSEFPNSVTVAFADPPAAGMVYEGDFVGGVIGSETESVVGEDADFFEFPAIDDSPTSVVVSGDVAVLMNDTEAGKAFIEYLGTPEAGQIWAELGGFTSANTGIDASVYPDDVTRRSAEALVAAGDAAKYDLGDLQPAAFGATEGQGYWGLLQEFVQNPDPQAIAQQLEEEAAAAFK